MNASNLAFSGNRCARIVTQQPGPRAQIGLQRRFDVPEVSDEVIEFAFRPTADKPVDLDEFVLWVRLKFYLRNAKLYSFWTEGT